MDIFNYCKLIGDKYFIKSMIRCFGMKIMLENMYDVVKELGDEDYILSLRHDLETALENYNRRYDNEK